MRTSSVRTSLSVLPLALRSAAVACLLTAIPAFSLITIDGSTYDFGNEQTLGSVLLKSGSLGAVQNENGTLLNSAVEVQTGTVTVKLSGSTSLTKTGAGTVLMYSKNSDYTGATIIEQGYLKMGENRVLSEKSALTVDGGAQLLLNGYGQVVSSITLKSGTITGVGVELKSSSDTAIRVYSGTIDAKLVGTGLTKDGTGTFSFSGTADLRNGKTTINGGILDLTGSTILNTSMIEVNSAGTLRGSGNLTGTTVTINGGTIESTGNLTIKGNQTLGSYDFNIWDAAGNGWAKTNIDGALTLSSAFNLKVIGLTSATGDIGKIANFNDTKGTTYSWTFLTATSISGFGATAFTIDTSGFKDNNPYTGTFSVQQVGNSLDLMYTAVPEPGTYALLLGLGTLGFISLRRWHRRHAAV